MFVRSPIFYMGNKYDLLGDIIKRMPQDMDKTHTTFIDVFGGSGVVSANMLSYFDKVVYNELNKNVFDLFNSFNDNKDNYQEHIIDFVKNRIEEFDLFDVEKQKYLNYRKFYNEQENKDIRDVLLLSFYSFSNMMRFNGKNEFNMPHGNRFYVPSLHDNQIGAFCEQLKVGDVKTLNLNAFDLLDALIERARESVFIYLDPPYTNTLAVYNEMRKGDGQETDLGGWGVEQDALLMEKLNILTTQGTKWMLSNVLIHKGKTNEHLKKWADDNNYFISYINNKEYAANGKGNALTQEIIITNYEPPYWEYNLFDF